MNPENEGKEKSKDNTNQSDVTGTGNSQNKYNYTQNKTELNHTNNITNTYNSKQTQSESQSVTKSSKKDTNIKTYLNNIKLIIIEKRNMVHCSKLILKLRRYMKYLKIY